MKDFWDSSKEVLSVTLYALVIIFIICVIIWSTGAR